MLLFRIFEKFYNLGDKTFETDLNLTKKIVTLPADGCKCVSGAEGTSCNDQRSCHFPLQLGSGAL